jgi:hypothetical protein
MALLTRKERTVATQKGPVYGTGGAGHQFDDHVAARFLVDLLSASNTLGESFGQVTAIQWQARDTGWLFDDLVVESSTVDGGRSASISVKSGRYLNQSGFPADFVQTAWEQWHGVNTPRRLKGSRDVIAIATGELADTVREAWTDMLRQALEADPVRVAARLAGPTEPDAGAQSSQTQRALFQSLACPDSLRDLGASDAEATVQLLAHIRVVHVDFKDPQSRETVRAVGQCRQLLRSGDSAEATRLWRALVALASTKRPTGGSVRLVDLLMHLRRDFELCVHPDYERDWHALNQAAREAMAEIGDRVAGLPPLSRESDVRALSQHLKAHRSCVVTGESGCGKSALVKPLAGGTRLLPSAGWSSSPATAGTDRPGCWSPSGWPPSGTRRPP